MLRVPLSSEGFFEEAQMKLRPMDFMREGIFLAGMAHYPKFIEESISQALAAAARALTLLAQGSLHLGGIVAQVDPDKCVGCLTCTRTCPFGIPQVIQQEGRHGVGGLGGAAYIDPAQCQGCGTCTGECPASAIQLMNYTDEQMMLRSIGGLGRWLYRRSASMSSEHKPFEPEITAFYCIYCGYMAADTAGALGIQYPANVKFMRMPCTGKTDIRYLLEAFEQGADGVYLVACPIGNCHHVRGNERGRARLQRAKQILDEIGLGGDRLEMFLHVRQPGARLCRSRRDDDRAHPKIGSESAKQA